MHGDAMRTSLVQYQKRPATIETIRLRKYNVAAITTYRMTEFLSFCKCSLRNIRGHNYV